MVEFAEAVSAVQNLGWVTMPPFKKMIRYPDGVLIRGEGRSRSPSPTLLRYMYHARFWSGSMIKGLIDMTAVDRVDRGESLSSRFSLVLLFLSLVAAETVFVLTLSLPRDVDQFLTFQRVYSNAGWAERECWDMFGIVFIGNSDLRRILTDYGFVGFPLRKDFPVVGFFETRYDEETRQLRTDVLSLAQEMRIYGFSEPV